MGSTESAAQWRAKYSSNARMAQSKASLRRRSKLRTWLKSGLAVIPNEISFPKQLWSAQSGVQTQAERSSVFSDTSRHRFLSHWSHNREIVSYLRQTGAGLTAVQSQDSCASQGTSHDWLADARRSTSQYRRAGQMYLRAGPCAALVRRRAWQYQYWWSKTTAR